MKILITDGIDKEGLNILQKENYNISLYNSITIDKLQEEIKDSDAVIIRSATKLTKDILEKAVNLKVIGRAGAGIDNVDVDYATKKGIVVMNVPGGNTISVAEHTMALILAACKFIPQSYLSMKNEKWEKKNIIADELKGKALGIIGLGRIGRYVAKLATAFRMEIFAYDPIITQKIAEECNAKLISLQEIFSLCDVVTLHCPLTKETRNLINREILSKAKKGIILVNCARGEIIDEEALLWALDEGIIKIAALDVFKEEPPKNWSLIKHPKVISTPHIAGATKEAHLSIGISICNQIKDFLKYQKIENAVNFLFLTPEEWEKIQYYAKLAYLLGSFTSQISNYKIEKVEIKYNFPFSIPQYPILTNYALMGLLENKIEENINMVNAKLLAEENGISIDQITSSNLSNSIEIITNSKSNFFSIEGSFSMNNYRIIKINGFTLDILLSESMIFMRNKDVPGVIGKLGTFLGNYNINIGNFSLSRDISRKEAIAIMSIDNELSAEAIKQIESIKEILQFQPIYLKFNT